MLPRAPLTSRDSTSSQPRLHLLTGGLECRLSEGLRVVAAPAERPPFAVDAVIIEDDTWHVLGAPIKPGPLRPPRFRAW